MKGKDKGGRAKFYILGFWPSASHSGGFAGVLFSRSRRAWRSRVGRRRRWRDPWLGGFE